MPMGGRKPSPNPTLRDVCLAMDLTAERLCRKYGIQRENSEGFVQLDQVYLGPA